MINEFEWDESKRVANQEKHGIDFEGAARIFQGRVVLRPARKGSDGEERWIAVGLLADRIIAVVYTKRGSAFRLISARRARKNEQRAYRSENPTNTS